GGPAILCADACEAEGLEVPVLTAASQAALRALLAPQASVTNPVDMIAAATAEQYQSTIEIVAKDPNVDALVVIYIPPVVTRPEGPRPEFPDMRRDTAAALVAWAMGRGEGWLSPDEVTALLACYGVPMVETRTVADAEQAEVAAREMNAPVALKAIAPGLVHK